MTCQLKELVKKMCLQFYKDCNESPEVNKNELFYDNWFERFGEDYLKSNLDFEVSIKINEDFENLKLENLNKKNTKTKSKVIIEKFYDKKGNASHYDSNRLNSIIKFERVWGTLGVMIFCEITADRYRERIGKKDNQSLEQELMKINWYEKASNYFFNKLGTKSEVHINNNLKVGLPWEKD